MTINQIELLVGIQALVLACRDQTGHRAYCAVSYTHLTLPTKRIV